jgi:hypothetical protein
MTPSKTQPALLGGLAIGVLSALPVVNLANCCCAWILFGGGLAAYLMQQNHAEPISAGDGAVAGLMAGAVGAFVWAAISLTIHTALAPFQAQMLRRALENANDFPPAARDFLQSMAGQAAIGVGMVLLFVVMLCVSSFFGMLGGLFGALIFRKNAPPPPPVDPGSTFTPPPLPPTGGS